MAVSFLAGKEKWHAKAVESFGAVSYSIRRPPKKVRARRIAGGDFCQARRGESGGHHP